MFRDVKWLLCENIEAFIKRKSETSYIENVFASFLDLPLTIMWNVKFYLLDLFGVVIFWCFVRKCCLNFLKTYFISYFSFSFEYAF